MMQKTPKSSNVGRRVASFLIWLVLVTGGVYAIRAFMVEGYYIPSASMEPTFMGDPSSGDRVVVDKTSFARHDPSRWEIAVFSRPGETGTFVKRIVGLPGEELLIRDGDVYDRDTILTKPPALLAELLVPVFDSRDHAAHLGRFWQSIGDLESTGTGSFRLHPDAAGEASIATSDDVTDGYWRNGEWRPGSNPVGDLALSVRVALDPGTREVELSLTDGDDRIALVAGPSKPAELWCGSARIAVLPGIRLETGASREIGLSCVDEQVVVTVDDDVVFTGTHRRAGPSRPWSVQRANVAELRIVGGAATVQRLRLRRDLYYTIAGSVGVTAPCPVGDGEYYLLGDNSRNSCDSRDWGCIHRSALIGAPILIVWPSARARLF